MPGCAARSSPRATTAARCSWRRESKSCSRRASTVSSPSRSTCRESLHPTRSSPGLALANGHIGLRANLDEGEPFGLPGTYLNSFYEQRPLPYAELGYGFPESGQTLVNVTNGKIIRLLVDDEAFDVRYGKLRAHERVL